MPQGLLWSFELVVEPRLTVDAVHRKYFDQALFKGLRNAFDEVKAFVFEVVGRCARKHQDWSAIVTIAADFHLLVEAWAVPGGDVSAHGRKSTERLEQWSY